MRPGQAMTFVTTGLDKPIHKQKKMRGKKVEGSEDIKKNRNVEGYRCGEKGHYANKGPNKKIIPVEASETEAVVESEVEMEGDDDDESYNMNCTWHEASTFATCREDMVNNAVDPRVKVCKGYFLLDNQADISIVDPRYLRQIEDCKEVRVNGIGELSVTV